MAVISMEYAPAVYRALNGIFCIYKPQGQTMKLVQASLCEKLAAELNSMRTRPVRERVLLEEVNPNTNLPRTTTTPDLSDHPLVVGARYINSDITMRYADGLDKMASGVVVVAIGSGCKLLAPMSRSRYIRTYHVKGELGIATQDFTPSGKIIQKTTYHHISHGKIDRVVAAMQSAHQKYMYEATGVDRQSESAYQMASRGLLRADVTDAGPVVYGMKCVHFEPPDFTLEVHTVNENGEYLCRLIHLLAHQMRTGAVCTQVRRIRYGQFTLDHALLNKHWNTKQIRDNILYCSELIDRKQLWDNIHSQEVTQRIDTDSDISS